MSRLLGYISNVLIRHKSNWQCVRCARTSDVFACATPPRNTANELDSSFVRLADFKVRLLRPVAARWTPERWLVLQPNAHVARRAAAAHWLLFLLAAAAAAAHPPEVEMRGIMRHPPPNLTRLEYECLNWYSSTSGRPLTQAKMAAPANKWRETNKQTKGVLELRFKHYTSVIRLCDYVNWGADNSSAERPLRPIFYAFMIE